MKKIIAITLGIVLLTIGLIGLVIPIIPGILFLLLAGLAFAAISPSLRRRLNRHPRFRTLFSRMDQGHELNFMNRCKLVFWSALEALSPQRGVHTHAAGYERPHKR